MRIMVTGAAGMLGSSLLPVLREREHSVLGTDIRLLDSDTKYLDARILTDLWQTASDYHPEVLVHLAAETDLEVCETKVDYAYEENYSATHNACVVCRRLRIPLVYISTAGVFDGTKVGPYTEFDSPNPINVYGASKLQGERIVREIVPEHFIVRAGWMIGGGERDRKFVSKIVAQLRSGVRSISAVNDRFGTPTYAPEFSKILERLIRTDIYGTYHLACKGSASRYDVAAEMLRILRRENVRLSPVPSEHFSKEYFAPRPKSEEMRNMVLDLMKMNDMPNWRDALKQYLQLHFKDDFQ